MTPTLRPQPNLAGARPCPSRACVRGFTLVEVISTIVIMAIVGGVASRIAFQSFQVLNDTSTRSDLQDQLSSAMERISTELRTIEIQPGASPIAPDINAASGSSISFNAGSSPRTLTLEGTNLRLTGQLGSEATLAANISSFVVQCYDGANAPLPSVLSPSELAAVRRIQITLVGSSGGVSETLRTKFFVRCTACGSGAP